MSGPQSESDHRRPVGLAEWLVVAWIIGYAVFFFHFTLPNSNPPVSRVDVWLELPEVLGANVVAPPKSSGASWSHVSQRFDLFAVAAVIWLGSWAVGGLLLRALRIPLAAGSAERLVCACGLGLSAVSLLTLGCGLMGWLSPWLLGGALAAAVIGEGWMCMGGLERFQVAVAELARVPPRSLATSATDNRYTTDETALGSLDRVGSWELLKGFVVRGEQLPYPLVAKSLAVVALSLFLLAMLLGSVLPPTDFDVKAYHLTGPKEYFLDGQITFLEHNVYTNFPFLTEMLCLLGMVLRQDWYWGALAGQVVLMGFAPLTGLALFCAGRRWFGEPAGWLAAVIYLSTPWTYRLAIIAYVEGALSCYLFLSLFAVLLAVEAMRREGGRSVANRMFLLAGLFAGSAMSCKYPGLVSVVIPLGLACCVVAVRGQGPGVREQRSAFKAIAIFLTGTALAIGPWLLKNLVMTGNPVYPLAYGLFGGRDWDAASHAKWRAGHSPKTYAISDLAEKFIDVTAKADWLSPLLFGLAPLALIAVGSRSSTRNSELGTRNVLRFLWLYVAFLFLQWWLLTHRIDRFWVPLIPVVSLLAAVGCLWSSSKLWRRTCGVFVSLSVLFNLGFVTTPLCGFNGYLLDLHQARAQSESVAEGVHYLNQLSDAGKLPRDATVLCVGEAQVFDARMRVIYNTVFDQPIFRDWLADRPAGDVPDRDWPLRSIDEVRRRFESEGVTHVLVNWEELLRYRMTYGYSDFVSPKPFDWLREQGLLGAPVELSWRPFDSLRTHKRRDQDEQREVEAWAPELKRSVAGKLVFVKQQLFAVQPSRSKLERIKTE